jgi:adsorption protein B
VTFADKWVVAGLAPLAVWILLSGLDDFFLIVVTGWDWFKRRFLGAPDLAPPPEDELARTPQKRVAIFVPLWHEHRVILQMLQQNLASIRYGNFDVLVGGYPNDELTLDAVHEAERRFPNVHLAVCPHDGPTSKADCLNWVYQRMLDMEEHGGFRYELIVVHDAEDLIHPEELRWLNYYADRYGMVQIPVLPLPTPWWQFTHGVYCDEFGEYQTKDMPARRILGGFIPSNGVGTGYARWALERLAEKRSNCIFDPCSLTEDYENGFRLHELGCPQLFVPIRKTAAGDLVATREYFPGRFRSALKQRTRWVTGNALQSWERHGWNVGLRQAYWFWRDRKGLAGNPITVLANLALLYGVTTWLWSRHTGAEWGLGKLAAHPLVAALFWVNLLLQLAQIGVRCGCVTRLYGWRFALATPLRVLWANWINSCATAFAVGHYVASRLRGEPLVWIKTEHVYPSRAGLTHHRRLGEVLVGSGYTSKEDFEKAMAEKPPGVRTGDYLVSAGYLTKEDLYEALSLQHSVPFEPLEARQIPVWVARALPVSEARRWRVVPFKVSAGRLYVAGPELPTDEMRREIRKLTGLEIQFHYITPDNLRELMEALLGRARAAS